MRNRSQRDEVGVLVGPNSLAFYGWPNEADRTSAAVHYARAKEHDVLQLTPLDRYDAGLPEQENR